MKQDAAWNGILFPRLYSLRRALTQAGAAVQCDGADADCVKLSTRTQIFG